MVEVTLTEDQQFPETSREGNRMILRHHLRTHPCFYITGSEESHYGISPFTIAQDGGDFTVYKGYHDREGVSCQTSTKRSDLYGDGRRISFRVCRRKDPH